MASETMTEPNDDQVERTVAWDTRFKSADLRAVEPVDLLQIIPSSIQNDAPTTLMLRPTELWIDGRYQRDISRAGKKLILDIVENFSWHKFRAPVVTRDEEGRYVVIDGQHTAIGAASHPGIKKIPVSFIPMKDLREQALAFISHNTAKVNVPSIDLFFSKVTANDPTAVEVLEVLQKYGVSLARYLPSQGHYEPNQTIATGRLTMLFDKYSRTKFEDIIRTIAEMNLRPISATIWRPSPHCSMNRPLGILRSIQNCSPSWRGLSMIPRACNRPNALSRR